MQTPIVIVGAGLGGSRVASELRDNGFEGPIVLIGEETHAPYDRPPLSKALLLGTVDQVDLNPTEFYEQNRIELRTGTRVTAVDPVAKTVTVEPAYGGSSEAVAYSSLVLATGLKPRMLPFALDRVGVHVLRTIDDARSLRAASKSATHAVIVGAGFIGCEVAASLRTRGLSVTVVEASRAPLSAALGIQVGTMVGRLHAAEGVDLRTGVGITGIIGEQRVTGVTLSDGDEIRADIVVLGIGSTPVVDLVAGSGIEIADSAVGGGISCDANGHASVPDVYAVGDVANWRDNAGSPARVEHWNNVVAQATTVAATILDIAPDDRPAVSYFWSDQFDLKLQALGHPGVGDDVHVVSDEGGKFVVLYSREGKLTAVVGVGKPAAVMKMRSHVIARTPIHDLV
ncbi:NAD(P)/FAD-dependent oxidoreductase [Rhodococcoides kyotonense]|uniref:Reductase C-terminal n=1 Tax=Rhodococcoides kyotonense TaxID=398843 RepID=A0A239M0S0_9NOCA|nr:FAD-dependent oxidoreductase [Rhodococcus kyotonensis]SNT36437.1 Reductase C-terminal [Rhodococcus kyotonensis]